MKEREQQGGIKKKNNNKIKNGTLEICKRARKSRVQNTRELTVNLQSPGREREEKRGEIFFVEKKQMVEERVDGGVEILLAPGVPPLPECPAPCKSHLPEDLKENLVLELSPGITGRF